ncbi:putative 3-hydroxyacyl-CoA dehydrogenase [Mariannaea sp. PMI_226]|nr:putative 3-hydroxyacyl-CoA dehydrogenase [Mariannaea sp. PMI_226]
MPAYHTVPESFSNLKDQVVVLTGGAHGVGESIVRTLFQVGAHVVFGDIDEPSCLRLVETLKKDATPSTGTLHCRRVDVRLYSDNLSLFQDAFERYGRVDHALSIAGVTEGQNWFDPSLDLNSITQPPSTSVLDINLLGALYFARIAAVYLRQDAGSGRDKSLLLTGSLAAFKEQAGLFVYQPSKHGVMGLFRSTRKNLYSLHGIRVNILCPSLISTGMSSKIQHVWEEKALPINTAKEVGDYAVSLAAVRSQGHGLDQTGLAVYVEGGEGWELESELDRLDTQWMGVQMAKNCEEINRALGVGAGWTTERPKI